MVEHTRGAHELLTPHHILNNIIPFENPYDTLIAEHESCSPEIT